MRRTLFILFAICALALPACDDLKTEESRKVLLGIATQVRQLDAETTKLQKQLKDSDVEQLKKINDKIDSKVKLREQLVQSAATLEAEMLAANDGGDVLVGVVKTAAPFMGPYGPLVLLGITVLSGLGATIKKHKDGKKKEAAMKAALVSAHNNIDSVIADPNLSGGAGKFDANDAATIARLKDLDRQAGLTELMAEASQ